MGDSRRRLFILGLCKNCSSTLPSFLAMINGFSADPDFEVHSFFGENGSVDDTRVILERAASVDSHINIIDTSSMAEIPDRLSRMAAGREILRKSLPPAQAGDVVLVIDVDVELVRPITASLLRSAMLELDEPYTIGVCSHSVPFHYDILALRREVDEINPSLENYKLKSTLGVKCSRVSKIFYSYYYLVKIYFMQRMTGVGIGKSFASAFNGMCMYHRSIYEDVSYISPKIDCEHVNLNLAMRHKTGGSVRVSAYLGVIAPSEHIVTIKTIFKSFFRNVCQALDA